ncbi:MAG: tetratricopeptide repeat protein, partial [Pseudomonadota bacterium]
LRNAETPTIALEFATFLIRRQEFDSAEATLQRVLNRNPRNVRAIQLMAQVKLSLRQWEAAQNLARRMRELDTTNNVISDQIDGIALQGRGLFEESVKAFESVQQAVPNDIRPIVTLVRSYIQTGNVAKAKQFLESTIRSDTNATTAHLLLAQVHLTENDKTAAETSLTNALASDRTSVLPYRALADFYRRERRTAEAETILRDGLKVEPNDLALGMNLALLLQAAGRDDEAISIYENMLSINENADVVINNLAALLTLKGDDTNLERAHDLASRFHDSTVPHFQDTLGWIYHLQGRIEEAQPLLRSAADLLPNAPDVVYHLGKNYHLRGDDVKAAQQLRKAISMERPFPGIEDARETLARIDG